jgi:hypothetical protein
MPPPRPDADALSALRERLDATQRAAQRLAEDAARERDGDRPPAAGWDVPRSADAANTELEALVGLLGALRDVLPPDLRVQLAELARQLLVFVRAVLDWWIGRLETGATGPVPTPPDAGVEDIPIG